MHFFDRDGLPLHNIDKLLAYLAFLPRTCNNDEEPEMIYCQDKMLFRFDYVENQHILTPKQLAKLQRTVKVVEVDVSKSLNFLNNEAEDDSDDEKSMLGATTKSAIGKARKGPGLTSPSKSRLSEIISASDKKKERPKYQSINGRLAEMASQQLASGEHQQLQLKMQKARHLDVVIGRGSDRTEVEE